MTALELNGTGAELVAHSGSDHRDDGCARVAQKFGRHKRRPPVPALYHIHGNLPALEPEQFAARNILQPPSEAEMLALFSKAESS